MNLVARQIFGNKKGGEPNTFIGGVSGTISTAALLATKLSISVGAISNFTIVGSDIKCRITGSYAISSGVFEARADITSYYDYDGLVTSIGAQAFNICSNVNFLWFPNCTSVTTTSIALVGVFTTIYIPRCTSMGATAASNTVFGGTAHPAKLYCPISLQTNNGGSPDGDITSFISLGGSVSYVSNFTAPSVVSDLSAGTIYNTSVQLNFTVPSSTNAIDFYEVYVNGVYNSTHKSSVYAINLAALTNYSIAIYAIDIFYNKSLVSNSISVTTANVADSYYVTDADATTYLTNAGISSTNEVNSTNYQFYQLKNKSLFWDVQAMYLFKGTASSQHKYNAKNPLDTDAAFRLTFNGTATYSNDGYTPNGSNGYANSYFIPKTNQLLSSNGITVVIGTNNVTGADAVNTGVYQGETTISLIATKGDNSTYYREIMLNGRAGEVKTTGVNEARGIFTGTKQSLTSLKFFRNNSLLGSGSGGGNLCTIPFFIGALNYNGSAIGKSNQRIQQVIYHKGLSDSRTGELFNIIDYAENLAARKTW